MRMLSIGCTFSDRVEALLDGRVTVEGHDCRIEISEAQRLFRSVLRDQLYDVAELSLASHVAAVAAGRRDYVGVPVFLSRSFRHSNLYVRSDRIARPEDLAGRSIGVIDYQQTAALWLRGILADDHGVARASVRWIAAGLQTPVTDDRAPSSPREGIRLERSSSTLDSLLRSGAIDAVISPRAPTSLADAGAPVARMWPDARAVELDWWNRERIFPIMHVLVVRRTLVDAEPNLPQLLLAAFERARILAAADVRERDFPKLALPWLPDHARESDAALGCDPWTYGLPDNERVLETVLRYAIDDGLAPPSMTVEALFA